MGDKSPVESLLEYVGLQQPQANNPFATKPPTLTELALHSLGGALNPNRAINVPNTFAGRALGVGSRLAGGLAGGLGEAITTQRLDPLQRQLAIAQQVLTQANPPVSQIDPATITVPSSPEGGFAPLPMMPGQGGFAPLPPPPGPLSGVSPQQLVAAGVFPTIAEQISPTKQAQIRSAEALAKLHEAQAAELSTGGNLVSNLPNRIAIQLATDPATGAVNYEKAMEVLQRLRTNPQGADSRIFDYLINREKTGQRDEGMEEAIKFYREAVMGISSARAGGTEQGRNLQRNTPLAAAAAANVAAGAETGRLNITSSPRYIANQAAIVTARERAQRENARMSPEQERRLTMYSGIRQNLDTIGKTYDPGFVGGLPAAVGFQQLFDTAINNSLDQANQGKYSGGALIGRMQAYLGTIPARQARFYRALADTADRILRARSGAQINEQEAGRLLQIVPKATDMPAVFEPKFDDFANDVMGEEQSMLKAITEAPENIRRRSETAPRPSLRNNPQQRSLPAPSGTRTPAQMTDDELLRALGQ